MTIWNGTPNTSNTNSFIHLLIIPQQPFSQHDALPIYIYILIRILNTAYPAPTTCFPAWRLQPRKSVRDLPALGIGQARSSDRVAMVCGVGRGHQHPAWVAVRVSTRTVSDWIIVLVGYCLLQNICDTEMRSNVARTLATMKVVKTSATETESSSSRINITLGIII